MKWAIPIIHVLEKADYTKQPLVPLHTALPYPPLGSSSSIRIRTTYLDLTTNDFVYARLGSKLGWWAINSPPPPPPPFSFTPPAFYDPTKYGRIEAYPGAKADNPIINIDPWRQHIMPLCNCHLTFAPGAQLASHCLALDTAMALDAKAWMLHRLGFGREKRQFMHPVGEGDIGRPPSAPWKREDNVPKDAVLMAFAAGGKTAACSAHEVRKREEGGRLASSRGV